MSEDKSEVKMYFTEQLRKDIYWVGVNDRRITRFENMFPLDHGVAYNSYVILDDKTCVMDAVDDSMINQYMENLDAVLQGRELNYLVVHHMEPDHCGSIINVLDKYPTAQLIGNKKTFQFFEQFYSEKYRDRYAEVKDGDTLSLGKHMLTFITAPMVHWPEVMMSYEQTEKIFFSADAFGGFGAMDGNVLASRATLDEHWVNEARRYYINIVGKFGPQVQALFNKALKYDISMICPLHSYVHDNEKSIAMMLDKYQKWSTYTPERKGVVIAYASMYGNMEQACDLLAQQLIQRGVSEVKMFDISNAHYSFIIAEMAKYSHAVIVPINYNSGIYYGMEAFLQDLIGTGWQNRSVALMAGWSWGGKGLEITQEILGKAKGLTFVGEPLRIKSAVKEEDLPAIAALAQEIADSMLV